MNPVSWTQKQGSYQTNNFYIEAVNNATEKSQNKENVKDKLGV